MTKRKNRSYFATGLLIFVFLGFLVSFIFRITFFGGLMLSGFTAALVAGLADWFAVSALFRKPLGIKSNPSLFIRTDIISSNRERLTDTLVSMIENDLFSKENLDRKVEKIRLEEKIVQFLDHDEVKYEISEIIQNMMIDYIKHMNSTEIGAFLEHTLKEQRRNLEFTPLIIAVIEYTIKKRQGEKFIQFILEEVIGICKSNEISELIRMSLLEAKTSYMKEQTFRQWIDRFITDSTIDKLTFNVQKRLIDFLENIMDGENPIREKIRKKCLNYIDQIKGDRVLREKIDSWINNQLINKIRIDTYVTEFLQQYKDIVTSDNGHVIKAEKVESIFEALLQQYKSHSSIRDEMERLLQIMVRHWIHVKHHLLGTLVKEGLNTYTTDDLVHLIESKAGHDLQLIRVSGTLVGFFTGVILYLLTYWV
ncbi:DUF445 domain-containing protein [Terrilactibacillus laevilacticus]|uniref:DUF445 family protein n=1 Tax=Terrilactibacillus laevilacticus TaxID=1380157 RepID=A0ABW5PP18_9BACI|nr:DUF445 domain-containing protein [Terrilactibacillus laevilacticus]